MCLLRACVRLLDERAEGLRCRAGALLGGDGHLEALSSSVVG